VADVLGEVWGDEGVVSEVGGEGGLGGGRG